MSSPVEDDNSNMEDECQEEKLDFEENELLDENSVELNKPDASPISLSSNGSLESSTENLNLIDKQDESNENVIEKKSNLNDKKPTTIKLKNVKNNEEEGELKDDDSDDDLEDGELKDDDPVNQSLDSLIQKNNNNKLKDVLCKFYTNGACTWGDNCRFKHCDLAKSNNQVNNYQNTNQSNPNRSANQKYYQNKPQYNKYNNSTNNFPSEHDNRADYDYDANNSRRNDDYERKRRLALESAPWNDYSNPDYDNQRSYSKGNFSSGRNYAKNYDASGGKNAQADSFHSDRSSSSFSDFSSEKSFKETSPPEKRSKYNNYEIDPHISSSHSRSHQYSKRDNRDYKWKDDDNGSTSSYFTESESLDGQERKYQKRRTSARSPISSNIRKRSRSTSRRKESYYHYSREHTKTLDKAYPAKSSHSNNNSNSHNRSVEEKKPIKMTFLRKQQSLKNVKLANPKDEFESEEEIENSDDRNESPYNKEALESKMPESSSREELLKRLKEIDEAISRKRAKKA